MQNEHPVLIGQAPATDEQVIGAMKRLPYERALELAKYLVGNWLGGSLWVWEQNRKLRWEYVAREVNEIFSSDAQPFWRAVFATEAHHYTLKVSPRYLGLSVQCRIARPGETHLRGRDLPDGEFSESTWTNIVRGLIANEMVELDKPIERGEVFDLHSFLADAEGRPVAEWAIPQHDTLLGKGPSAEPTVVLDDPLIRG